jgi:hypothetical protein
MASSLLRILITCIPTGTSDLMPLLLLPLLLLSTWPVPTGIEIAGQPVRFAGTVNKSCRSNGSPVAGWISGKVV